MEYKKRAAGRFKGFGINHYRSGDFLGMPAAFWQRKRTAGLYRSRSCMINVYIQPESSCEVDHEAVCIGDVADVYCRDEALQKRLEALVFMELKPDDETRYVISAMALVACIDRQAGQPVTVCNIGAGELILARSRPKQHLGATAARIVMVTMITFFGSIFCYYDIQRGCGC